MQFPIIRGVIERRILVNYRVDPAVVADILPSPLRPKLVQGQAIAGICLIRLAQVRPRGLPANLGLRSENAAHRIAVEWDDHGRRREGVYIPRRDSNSRLNTWLGGRVVPGYHEHARFRVCETPHSFAVALDSDDGRTHVLVEAERSADLPATSIFPNLADASAFFARGSVGYSPDHTVGRLQGIRLHTFTWQMVPLAVQHVQSSFFDDPARFPPGACTFDCALLMQSVPHEWRPAPDLASMVC